MGGLEAVLQLPAAGAEVTFMPNLTHNEVRERAKHHGYELEADFQGWIVDLAMLLGFDLIYHTHRSQHSPAGFPDLCMLKEVARETRRSAFVFLEVKGITRKGPGTVSAEQEAWIQALRKVGGNVYAAIVWPWQRDLLANELRRISQ